jgi:Pyridine nucleotide-disulphide oxidoreductase
MHLVLIGGSDAGISAALRARELDPSAEVTVVVADAYPNFSICGIPYYVSGEVPNWQNLAHRSIADLEGVGLALRLDTTARAIDVAGRSVIMQGRNGDVSRLPYDELVAGALPVHPPIDGLAELGVDDGVHVLHSMGDTFALMASLDRLQPSTALIVGAGYVGLEMADALVGSPSASPATPRVDCSARNLWAPVAPKPPNAWTSLPPAISHDMHVDAVSELDLSYTPPLEAPWDAVQAATQTWSRTWSRQRRPSQDRTHAPDPADSRPHASEA